MSGDESSSMISGFLTGLRHAMPPEEQAKLDPYDRQAAVAGSDKTAEWHRAYKCAKWAVQIVALPQHHQLLAEVQKAVEIVREVEKTVGGEIGNLSSSVSPRFEAEITWVYEAVRVAARVAGKTGWDAVPWQDLVTDMLSVEHP
ncbi:MAG: hypothetical protein ACYDH6_16390 [Acidimicrobiales bacterium]